MDMKQTIFSFKRTHQIALAITAIASIGFAQDDNDYGDIIQLDSFVVTGVASSTTKIKSSVSISSVDVEDLQPSAPRSTAEIFRTIPGIRSEATSGDGNANIAVRGLPVAAGGAKFLQLQEDGLPILEFGDIAFATADSFLRADSTVQRLEAIRGGSASTFASNSPGGIINFISNTGAVKGGMIGLTTGLDYDTKRLDYSYGSPIGDDLQFHVGGFYRIGEGPRNTGYDGNEGGQLKANITKFLENGYFRLYFKYLDDRATTYLPMPVGVTGTDSNPSYGSIPGFDPSVDTPHTSNFDRDLGIGGDGERRSVDIQEGLRTVSTSIGGELDLTFDNQWKLNNSFRISQNEGRFVSPFPAEVASAQDIADSIAGPGATLAYANGSNTGQTINAATLNGNGLLMRTHMFDTELNDFSNVTNNLKLSRSIRGNGEGRYDLTLGFYKSSQDINMDWLWNSYLLEVKGDNAALVDVFDADGNALSENGLYAYGVPFWGDLHRNYDTTYDINAPYASLAYESGPWTADVSIRYDSGSAKGTYSGTTYLTDFDVNEDGVISVPEQSVPMVDTANRKPVDYDWGYLSYSAGANYAFSADTAAFARYSRGGRANADRLLFGDNILADGSIRDDDAAVDMVNQFEAGLKHRMNDFGGGNLSLFATLFYAETEEQNFEATTQVFLDRVYEAVGLEVEAAYVKGPFQLRGGLTWTDSEITSDAFNPAVVGNTPRRQADLAFQLSPSYNAERWSTGLTIIGTTKSFAQDDNNLVMPGYEYVNLYTSYKITENLTALITVNNLFDEFGLSESEEGSIPGNNIIRARGITGRSSTISLNYRF